PIGLTNIVAVAAGGSHSLALCGRGPPVFLRSLLNREAAIGESVQFYVQVTGSPPLSYQWQFNGTNIPGANNPGLVLLAAAQAQAGTYSVVVSNAFGIRTNSASRLTVAPVVVHIFPEGQTNWVGGVTTLRAGLQTSVPITYQWHFGEADLPGETNETLVL